MGLSLPWLQERSRRVSIITQHGIEGPATLIYVVALPGLPSKVETTPDTGAAATSRLRYLPGLRVTFIAPPWDPLQKAGPAGARGRAGVVVCPITPVINCQGGDKRGAQIMLPCEAWKTLSAAGPPGSKRAERRRNPICS